MSTLSSREPEQWAVKQHIEKYPKCEWICPHTNLPNLGEEPTLSNVPEEATPQYKMRRALLEFDKSRGETGRDFVTGKITRQQADSEFEDDIVKILALINQQIKSVLDEALANSVFKHKHEAEEHVVDYENGYNDGVEAAEDVIREIRSRYE